MGAFRGRIGSHVSITCFITFFFLIKMAKKNLFVDVRGKISGRLRSEIILVVRFIIANFVGVLQNSHAFCSAFHPQVSNVKSR